LTGKYFALNGRFTRYHFIPDIKQFLKKNSHFILFLACILGSFCPYAQQITGVWKGRINKQKVELKLVQQGDSLTGSVYYYQSAHVYRHYSIKGYFDPSSNEAVWWDDQLIEEKTGRFTLGLAGRSGYLSRADFNCPGEGRMMLDGKTSRKEEEDFSGEVHLNKTGGPIFPDEWDFIIENYLVGANDPDLIDRIRTLNSQPQSQSQSQPIDIGTQSLPVQSIPRTQDKTIISPERVKPIENEEKKLDDLPVAKQPAIPNIEEKFKTRKQVLVKEIPLRGDSIELRFYDNAEIDGDSISLFLNGQLIFQNIRLTGKAYTIHLAIADLKETNDLIMVAENLGSIPPNTSYMVAIVDNERYEARLESNEGSSALIRFVKR